MKLKDIFEAAPIVPKARSSKTGRIPPTHGEKEKNKANMANLRHDVGAEEDEEDAPEADVFGGEEKSFPELAKDMSAAGVKMSTGNAQLQYNRALIKLAAKLFGDGGPYHNAFVKQIGRPLDFDKFLKKGKGGKDQGFSWGSAASREADPNSDEAVLYKLINSNLFQKQAKAYLQDLQHLELTAQALAPVILEPGTELRKELEQFLGRTLSPEDIKKIAKEDWFLDLIDQEVVSKHKTSTKESVMREDSTTSPVAVQGNTPASGTGNQMPATDPNIMTMKNMLNQKYKSPEEKVQALAQLVKVVLVTSQYRQQLGKILVK